MISFKQFLTEDASLPQLADIIEKECQPFLKRSGREGSLWRGIVSLQNPQKAMIGDEKVTYYVMTVRKDREARDTSPKIAAAIDNWFDDNLGIKARSQAMFCVGLPGLETAKNYGNHTCTVFPMGQFTYAWSPDVDDLYNAIYDGQGEDLKLIQANGKVDPERIDDFLSKKKYTMNGLDKAVQTDHEIMIDCEQYIALIGYADHDDDDWDLRSLGVSTDTGYAALELFKQLKIGQPR